MFERSFHFALPAMQAKRQTTKRTQHFFPLSYAFFSYVTQCPTKEGNEPGERKTAWETSGVYCWDGNWNSSEPEHTGPLGV